MDVNQNYLLQQVYVTGFQLDDILLYLDTHPDCPAGMQYYRQAQAANQRAVAQYEQAYGPLMVGRVNAQNWNWIRDPWPWEGGMG